MSRPVRNPDTVEFLITSVLAVVKLLINQSNAVTHTNQGLTRHINGGSSQ